MNAALPGNCFQWKVAITHPFPMKYSRSPRDTPSRHVAPRKVDGSVRSGVQTGRREDFGCLCVSLRDSRYLNRALLAIIEPSENIESVPAWSVGVSKTKALLERFYLYAPTDIAFLSWTVFVVGGRADSSLRIKATAEFDSPRSVLRGTRDVN